QVGLQVYRGATNVPRSSSRFIPFQEAIFDTHNVFESETSEIPVPASGIYLVHFRCNISASIAGSWRVYFSRNGIRLERHQGARGDIINESLVVNLSSQDYIQVEVYNPHSDHSLEVRWAYLSLVRF